MNKNIKRIIALAFALGTFSAISPATNFNLLTTKVYASNEDADELNSVDLQDDNGDSIDLYEDDNYDDEVDGDLDEGSTYYAESSTDEVKIDSVDGADDDKVRIVVGSDVYEVGDSIPVDNGITTLKVRVYEDDYDEDEDYSSSDYNEYKIKVEYTGDDSSDNDEDTLDSLELYNKNGNSIKLYSDSDYEDSTDSDSVEEGNTYYAKTSSDEVSIETSGPEDEYVRVFKSTNNSAKGMETGTDISVSEDKTLTVKLYSEEPDDDIEYGDDDNVIGEYKIKLKYTGSDSSSTSSTATTTTTTTSNSSTATASTSTSSTTAATSTPSTVNAIPTTTTASGVKSNQWVQVNGGWKYNDALGNPLKNQWFWDGNYGKWYYLNDDGMMAINSWILTGGKYYFVGSDGAMVTNTYISGYKIGTDGAWIQ